MHALHVRFSFLCISQSFSTNLRREMTCLAITLRGRGEHLTTNFQFFLIISKL